MIVLHAAGMVLWLGYAKRRHTQLPYLPVYISFIIAAEWIGRLLQHQEGFNTIFYSFIVHPITFIYLYWLTTKNVHAAKKNGLIAIFFSVVLLVVCALDYFVVSNYKNIVWFSSFSYVIGAFFLCILLARFFMRFIFSDEVLRFKTSTLFWFCVVIFIYYLGCLPFFALRNMLYAQYKEFIFMPYWYTQMFMSILLYISISIIYICIKPS
jgi:hypothetical protein